MKKIILLSLLLVNYATAMDTIRKEYPELCAFIDSEKFKDIVGDLTIKISDKHKGFHDACEVELGSDGHIKQSLIFSKALIDRIAISPEEFKFIQERVLRVIKPIKPATESTQAEKDFLLSAKRTQAGRSLPPYYLVYFLFVDLLGFKNLGQFEKVSWSVPIDYRGRAFLIEHRKFGLGIFARDSAEDEAAAGEIAILIHKGVKTARPYFDYIAQQAVSDSKVNVLNNSSDLYDRFVFLSESVKNKLSEAAQRKDEKDVDINEYDGWSWIP